MSYTVKEIFYTLQGEGANAGHAAVFLRFAGCNLWTGRELDRERGRGGCSRWCDTDFVGGTAYANARSLSKAVVAVAGLAWTGPDDRMVVCTGGEPLLQLDFALITELHEFDIRIAVETNGTIIAPLGIDWLCVSPKAGTMLAQDYGDELKLVYPQPEAMPERFAGLAFRHRLLQPMDGPEREANTRAAVEYCLAHPEWRLSLQTHKFIGIP